MTVPDVDHALLYGLHVRSELPMHQSRRPATDTAVDVEIVLGAPMTAGTPVPPGRVLLDIAGERPFYAATALADGTYLLRFHGLCDCVLSPQLDVVRVHLVDGVDRELVSVLLTGTVMAFLLTLRGHTVLHASAVQLGERALAFVGASGMGKSTMATLLCADGAGLITDDVLRVDLAGGAARCRLGATELRLRKAATELAAEFTAPPAGRTTGDGRAAIRPDPATTDGLELAAIVIPSPDHGRVGRPEVKRLRELDALLALVRFPRLLGWQDGAVNERHFKDLGEIVGRVPLYVARLPWGPPFPHGVGRDLLTALALAPAPSH